MNPARHGPELSTDITFKISNSPRCVVPCCFTHANSDRCVRRRVFGKQNEPGGDISNVNFPSRGSTNLRSNFATGGDSSHATSVRKKSSTENRGKTSQRKESRPYCPGDSAGVSSVPAGDSVVVAGDSVVVAGASVAAGLVSVVAGALVGAGVVAGVTVSVFCSHAARSAAPARMQMYFFIVGDAYCFN
jgi:hypothetical protein